MAGMDREALLRKIAKSDITAGGNNLRDGSGRLALRKFALESGFKGNRAVFDFIVVSSRKKEGLVSIKTSERLNVEPNAPGSDVSIVQMLDKHESAWGNCKNIVLNLFGETDSSEDELVDCMRAMEDNGIANGRVVDYDTYRKVTEEKKIEITLPKWFAVEQTDEDVAKTKKWLDSLVATTPAA